MYKTILFKSNAYMTFRASVTNWALPLKVMWINHGKDLMRGIVVNILFVEIEYNNGKVSF